MESGKGKVFLHSFRFSAAFLLGRGFFILENGELFINAVALGKQ
jgi:hypothetical protein